MTTLKSQKIDISKILLLWKGHETEFMQYHIVREYIKTIIKKLNEKSSNDYSKNATERTIMRYLQSLVEEKKLEKKIDPDHRTYYRPVNNAVVFQAILQNLIESAKIDSLEVLFAEISRAWKKELEKTEEKT